MTARLNDTTLSVERIIDAPIEMVWRAWTEPDLIKEWWGPDGYSTTILKMEVRTEGVWELIMHGPDGTDFSNYTVFKEIVKHEKIVYRHESEPKFTTTALFKAIGSKTEMVWTMVFDTKEDLEGAIKNYGASEGLAQNIIKLENFLKQLK
ncbi:MAG: SRPBCC domain-containing protein [bacterium]